MKKWNIHAWGFIFWFVVYIFLIPYNTYNMCPPHCNLTGSPNTFFENLVYFVSLTATFSFVVEGILTIYYFYSMEVVKDES